MDPTLQAGHDAIAAAVASLEPPVVVVEMHRQFGDILHATIVVRQLRAALPDHRIVFAVCEQYSHALACFGVDSLGPHAYAFLPRLPPFPDDAHHRIAWVVGARELPGVVRAFGCGVHPWGSGPGTIVDSVLRNAGIVNLIVPRRPCMPIEVADVQSARSLLRQWGIDRYVALEYRSFSHEPLPPHFYAQFVRAVGVPVVALAHADAPAIEGAIDGRATTLRQAKSLIADAACFVGGGSGLSVIAAALGCEQRVVENCDDAIRMTTIGYRRHGDRHAAIHTHSPRHLAEVVRAMAAGLVPAGIGGASPLIVATRPRSREIRTTRAKRTRLRRRSS